MIIMRAKTKYEDLVKQVSAIQKVNSQFSSPVIKDGVLDANAKVKSDATFAETKTGNDKLDSLLNEAVAQGRSQQVATPAPVDRNRWYRYFQCNSSSSSNAYGPSCQCCYR